VYVDCTAFWLVEEELIVVGCSIAVILASFDKYRR
jgi:hypothetical protein